MALGAFELPFTTLLSLYSTTTGFPCWTLNLPAPTKVPSSRSFSFSSPVSNRISMTRVVVSISAPENARARICGFVELERRGAREPTYRSSQIQLSSRLGFLQGWHPVQALCQPHRCNEGTPTSRCSCLCQTSVSHCSSENVDDPYFTTPCAFSRICFPLGSLWM